MKKLNKMMLFLFFFVMSIFLFSCEGTKVHIVTFKSDDGTILTQELVRHGKSATPPQDPEKEGYKFNGWIGNYYHITSDSEVTASFDIKVYQVTFKDDNGYIIKQESVKHGSSAIPPTDPVKVGYTFDGWSVDFSNVYPDLEVVSTYKRNSYTVIFKNEDGTIIDTQTVLHGENAYQTSQQKRSYI